MTGVSVSNVQRSQRIMNTAARLLLRLPKFSHISAVMIGQLHWLPAVRRTQFKSLLSVALHCIALLVGHHSIFENSASWCRQYRDVGIFVLQISFSSLYQDVTVLQHRKVAQWLAHRGGIVCLRRCVKLPFNFHVDRLRRI